MPLRSASTSASSELPSSDQRRQTTSGDEEPALTKPLDAPLETARTVAFPDFHQQLCRQLRAAGKSGVPSAPQARSIYDALEIGLEMSFLGFLSGTKLRSI